MTASFAESPTPAPSPPKLYTSLADWWHLLSPAEEYAEEAEIYSRVLAEHARSPVRTLLELGSGGGNNASHMKARFDLTLVELSEDMVAQSRRINPELEHHVGDMRTVRLGREFDAVFIHDAICYMATAQDLRLAIETAYTHCRQGGVALFAPDHVLETFRAGTSHGGADGADRALRYLEWTWDPDPTDSSYCVDYAYVLHLADGSVRVEYDRHVEGLFPRQTWLDLLAGAGFDPRRIPVEHSELEPGSYELFVGIKP
jgi:SAM-dependent methyltransferase